MKILVLLVVLLGLMGLSSAAVARGSYADPEHPGKCVLKGGVILSPGKHKNPTTECGLITCAADGSAELQTCGLMAPPPGCEFGEYVDTSLDYPGCCKKHISCVAK